MDPVAITAYWVAAARAIESKRPDALFHDPFAASLAGEEGSLWTRMPEAAPGNVFVALRTRFFDDELLRATRERKIRQVILLAAGMDARAYRLEWPVGTRVYELDQPEVLSFKEAKLAALGAVPSCTRVSLAVDLTDPWEDRLLAAGFSPALPSAWLIEGLLVYLTERDVHTLLTRVSALAAPGSTLAHDSAGAELLTSGVWSGVVRELEARGIQWHYTSDNPAALLDDFGWNADAYDLDAIAHRYGRNLARGEDPGASYLVAATRRKGISH